MERVYSYNPGAHTGKISSDGANITSDNTCKLLTFDVGTEQQVDGILSMELWIAQSICYVKHTSVYVTTSVNVPVSQLHALRL